VWSWSPDGRKIAVSDWRHVVYVVDVATGKPTRLVPGDWPTWSPDGARIAFVHGSGLYSVRADGSSEAKLWEMSGAEIGQPQWSPDGDRLLFEASRSSVP
jgi:Tol biopolymer transport system component